MEAHKRKIAAHAAVGATFEKHALLWHETQKARWSPVQINKVEQAPPRRVPPTSARLPLIEIDGPMILKVVRKVEARGAVETAKRVRHHVSGMFQLAMAERVVGTDPAAGIGKGLRPGDASTPAMTDAPTPLMSALALAAVMFFWMPRDES